MRGQALKVNNQRGFTLIEVLVSLFLIIFTISMLMSIVLQLRERQISWIVETSLEQEALRFFTYVQNRHTNLYSWSTSDQRVTLVTYQPGQFLSRELYLSKERVIERDLERGGTIILSHHVKDITYRSSPTEKVLYITLTLSKDGYTREYVGILTKGIFP